MSSSVIFLEECIEYISGNDKKEGSFFIMNFIVFLVKEKTEYGTDEGLSGSSVRENEMVEF